MNRSTTTQAAQIESIWSATAKMPNCRRLSTDVDADVCIVGAGIAGLTTAYLLAKEGKSVAVLDDGGLVSGMTQVTTAHLMSAIDDRFFNIEWWHGERGAQLAAESHARAVDRIQSIAEELMIDCELQRLDGYLLLGAGQSEELLDRELAAARRAGVAGVEKVARAPLKLDTGPCLRFPRQGRFHPLKYLAGMARAIKRRGGRIFTNSHVDSMEGGMPARVAVGSHEVRAKAVVVATNSPINDMLVVHTKQAPYMTYVIGAKVQRGAVTDALYWDMLDPYHYVRLESVGRGAVTRDVREGFDLLIVGGEDHKSGQADDTQQRHARLETWARAYFPMMEDVKFKWAGQCMETIDGLAFIGRNPLDKDNVYIVTGDSGMGMTHGTIAGMLLADLICGRDNPWAQLYDPARKTLRAAGNFAKEAVNMAGQYLDWVTPGEVSSVDDVAKGSGAVLRRGMSKIAVYRDGRGQVHERSAVCPHLGGIVHWNAAETTWDCPCHGSRFDPLGKVINGPSNVDLAPWTASGKVAALRETTHR
jgi:glycine/D-amino acid oxidase-like deaminating enzyme/nitrite reductase/ring-hydroxylating ferredoxin subunit